jgi:DNA repair protein RecO (recombination protein O)
MQIEHQPAYVLHTRPYRDTSMLVDFLTPQFGRVSAVARGVRARKNLKRSLLNPFSCLLISFQGKTELKLLTQFESTAPHFDLKERHLYAGFYVNELMVRLLPELDAHEELYSLYQQTLARLHQKLELEPVLRYFELQLLAELGYGISFQSDANTGLPLVATQHYALDAQLGFLCVPETSAYHHFLVSGEAIMAIANHDYSSAEVRQAAKKITRTLLRPLLGSKPLASRDLFI